MYMLNSTCHSIPTNAQSAIVTSASNDSSTDSKNSFFHHIHIHQDNANTTISTEVSFFPNYDCAGTPVVSTSGNGGCTELAIAGQEALSYYIVRD